MLPPPTRHPAEAMREELVQRDRIAAFVADGPKTIPQIARHLDRPASEVVIWVMAMCRYRRLEASDTPDAQGYYQYGLEE